MSAGEEETDTILVAKANQLQRQSDEISNRIKVYICVVSSFVSQNTTTTNNNNTYWETGWLSW